MIAMHVHRQLGLIILLLGIREKLTQEDYFLFCKKYEKESIILTVSFQLENLPFNIKSYCFECNDCNACSQTTMTRHFAFGYSRKG